MLVKQHFGELISMHTAPPHTCLGDCMRAHHALHWPMNRCRPMRIAADRVREAEVIEK
jgi:hypothetical protein